MRLRSLALPFAFVAAAFATSSSALSASGAPPVTVDQPQTPAATPSPATPTHPLEKADLEAWLDGFVPYALKNGDIAGAVVAVVKDGHVLVEKGYGDADVARKIPMDPEHTLVRIGSTSKLFTWTAVMQLVEQHKLDLDRDINDYLDFKVASKTGAPITLRDLMNHRAGFEEGLKDVLAVDPHALQTTEQYLKTHPRPMLFAPGEVPAYSNYGAALAGYIVQRVSGERFEDYVARTAAAGEIPRGDGQRLPHGILGAASLRVRRDRSRRQCRGHRRRHDALHDRASAARPVRRQSNPERRHGAADANSVGNRLARLQHDGPRFLL
jgi:CubicO group peptidase (beta-lactamase class C family)